MSERGSCISHASGSSRITAKISPFAFCWHWNMCKTHINRTNWITIVIMYLIFDCIHIHIHIHLNIRLFYESKKFYFLKYIVRREKKSVEIRALVSENKKKHLS
jgi:hypothetical protein